MAEFNNLYASLVRFTNDFIAALPTTATFVDFDQHADIDTLPAGDIVGIRSMMVDTTDKVLSINVMFGVSTEDDKNLFRHRDTIDRLFTALQPTKRVEYVDAVSAEALGYLIIQGGTTVIPISRALIRPFQQISVSLLGDRKPAL